MFSCKTLENRVSIILFALRKRRHSLWAICLSQCGNNLSRGHNCHGPGGSDGERGGWLMMNLILIPSLLLTDNQTHNLKTGGLLTFFYLSKHASYGNARPRRDASDKALTGDRGASEMAEPLSGECQTPSSEKYLKGSDSRNRGHPSSLPW